MREIKFRQWMGSQYHYWGLDGNEFIGPANFGRTLNQQFTGLRDKNGKEIYEGDIVNYGDYSDGSGPCDYVVEWSAEDAAFEGRAIHELDMVTGLDPSGEVIGNIYENPGLIT